MKRKMLRLPVINLMTQLPIDNFDFKKLEFRVECPNWIHVLLLPSCIIEISCIWGFLLSYGVSLGCYVVFLSVIIIGLMLWLYYLKLLYKLTSLSLCLFLIKFGSFKMIWFFAGFFFNVWSPLGEIFRSRLRQFPALVNCCTIDWFSEWPPDALRSVAERFFSELSELNVNETIRSGLVSCFLCCVLLFPSWPFLLKRVNLAYKCIPINAISLHVFTSHYASKQIFSIIFDVKITLVESI